MKPLEFELGESRWCQASAELAPPPAGRLQKWSHALAEIAREAQALPAAHLTIRFERFPGSPGTRRRVGIVVAPEHAARATDWLGRFARSGIATATGAAFWESAPDFLAEIPVNDYSAAGIPLACDFTLLSSIETLFSETADAAIPWCYQVNAVRQPLEAEERRSARKGLARLEHLPGVPSRIIKRQAGILETLERREWRFTEYLGAPDAVSFSAIRAFVDREFAASHGRSGYEGLRWPAGVDDDALDAWSSGLHPSAFVPDRLPGGFTDKQSLAALWTCRAGAAAPVEAPPRSDPGTPPEIFLSYSTRDTEAAFETCRILEREGIPCWIAPRDILPGREWAEAIVSGIDRSKVTVLLLSDGSNLSRYVLRELEITVSKEHPIVPIRLEECHLRDAIRFFLTSHQWFDASQPPLEAQVMRLIPVLKGLLATA